MRVRIAGKFWDLDFILLKSCRGLCEPPDKVKKRIMIDQRLTDEEKLEVILHELLHAAFWQTAEEHIEETAEDLARVLWRLGYRQKVQC